MMETPVDREKPVASSEQVDDSWQGIDYREDQLACEGCRSRDASLALAIKLRDDALDVAALTVKRKAEELAAAESRIKELSKVVETARHVGDALDYLSDQEGNLPIPPGPELAELMECRDALCNALASLQSSATGTEPAPSNKPSEESR